MRKSPGDRIVIGCIGVGAQGSGLLRGVLGDRQAQVVAICDVNRATAEKAAQSVEAAYAAEKTSGTFKGCDIYSDFRELLAKEKPDAAVHGLPDHWHGVISCALLRAGIDVYGEKPLAKTWAEGKAIADAVKENGRIWQTGMWQRSTPNLACCKQTKPTMSHESV